MRRSPPLGVASLVTAGEPQPKPSFAVRSIAADSKGNICTVKTDEARRLQKFVHKGLAPATKLDRGTAWPTQ